MPVLLGIDARPILGAGAVRRRQQRALRRFGDAAQLVAAEPADNGDADAAVEPRVKREILALRRLRRREPRLIGGTEEHGDESSRLIAVEKLCTRAAVSAKLGIGSGTTAVRSSYTPCRPHPASPPQEARRQPPWPT